MTKKGYPKPVAERVIELQIFDDIYLAPVDSTETVFEENLMGENWDYWDYF